MDFEYFKLNLIGFVGGWELVWEKERIKEGYMYLGLSNWEIRLLFIDMRIIMEKVGLG